MSRPNKTPTRRSTGISKARNTAAFTLVEIVVLGALIGMMLLIVSRHFQRAMRDATTARGRDVEERILGKMVADLRKMNIDFVLPASSKVKHGTRPFIYKKYHINYVEWEQSRMKDTLEEFESLAKQAGYSAFDFWVFPVYHLKARAMWNYYTTSSQWSDYDPNLKFLDHNGDGDFWDVTFDTTTLTWVTDWPVVNVRTLVIVLHSVGKDGRESPVAFREVELVRGELSSEAIADTTSPLPLAVDWPYLWVNKKTHKHYHQRQTAEERASLDLAIVKEPPSRFGLPPCREKRFDNYNDPVHGTGGLVIHGYSTPGASVAITHYGKYSPPPTHTGSAATPNHDTPHWKMILTADEKGEFLAITPDPWTDMVLGEWVNPLYAPHYYASGFVVRANKDGLQSQRADTFVNFNNDLSVMELTVTTGPVLVKDHGPVGVTKTLAADIFFEASRPVDEQTVTIRRDGADQPVWNKIMGLEEYNWLYAEYSFSHAVGTTAGPYANLPAILADNTTYTVYADFADQSCYKASAMWTFTVDLGPAGADDTDLSPPVVEAASLHPPHGGMGRPIGDLKCVIEDPESGVDYRTIELKVDGEVLVPAGKITREHYDPRTGALRYPLVHIRTGNKTVEVRASNFKGISMSKSWAFRLQ